MSPIGLHCPLALFDGEPWEAYIWYLERWIDEEGLERGKRIHGFAECPRCYVWWPCEEEPDCWEETAEGLHAAIGWWGASVCCDCNLLLVTQPDGTPEAYQL